MTVEMGIPGVSGYGFSGQGNSEQGAFQQQSAGSDQQALDGADGTKTSNTSDAQNSSKAEGDPDGVEETSLHFNYEQVPGFEVSASDCLNRARQIARSLNHLNLSSDHLMLALTMDPNARRLLERVSDVQALQEAAMQRLGRMNSRFSRNSEDRLTATSDLVDLGKKARDAAAERDQLVAISDLIAGFPRADGRLTYNSGETSQATALTTTFEQNVVPRISEAMNQIQALARDAMVRQQSVQSLLQDLSFRSSEDSERKQREFMDEIRRQVRDAADLQISAALTDFTSRFETVMAEVKEALKPVEQPEPVIEPTAEQEPLAPLDSQNSFRRTGSTWNWLGLL